VPMAMHFAGTPVACMANVHCAAATRNFLALENHSLDVPWWQDLVNEVDKPIIDRGYIVVTSFGMFFCLIFFRRLHQEHMNTALPRG